MNINELAKKLNAMYFNAQNNETVVNIHLFGIKYAKEITSSEASMQAIAEAAGIPKSYGTEISKGVKLSRFVEIIK